MRRLAFQFLLPAALLAAAALAHAVSPEVCAPSAGLGVATRPAEAAHFEQLNIELCGTVRSGELPGCFLRDIQTGRQAVYRIGDTLGDFRLTDIADHAVVFERDGRVTVLEADVDPEPEPAPQVDLDLAATAQPALPEPAGPVDEFTTVPLKVARVLKRRTPHHGKPPVEPAPAVVVEAALHKEARDLKDVRVGADELRVVSNRMFICPVPGARMTSPFGYRRHPLGGGRKFHNGIDLIKSYGAPILAAGDGKVTRVGRSSLLGRYIYVQHAKGYETRYAHLARILVRSGQQVRQGQTIGTLGSTGRVTGAHLHFEIRKNGAALNPQGFVTVRPN